MTAGPRRPAIDPPGPQRVRGDGLLADFNGVGVLGAADVHVAVRLGRLGGEADDGVLLAAALAVRALRSGSVCVDARHGRARPPRWRASSRPTVAALPWPEPAGWVAALRGSPLVAVGVGRPGGPAAAAASTADALPRPLLAAGALHRRTCSTRPRADPAGGRRGPARVPRSAGCSRRRRSDRQRLAAVVAAHRWVSVLAGGPGTGKTTTVAQAARGARGPARRRRRGWRSPRRPARPRPG